MTILRILTYRMKWFLTLSEIKWFQQVWLMTLREESQRSILDYQSNIEGEGLSDCWIMRLGHTYWENLMRSIRFGIRKERNMNSKTAFRQKKDLGLLINCLQVVQIMRSELNHLSSISLLLITTQPTWHQKCHL